MDTIVKIMEILSNVFIGLSGIIVAGVIGWVTVRIQKRQTKIQKYQYNLGLYKLRFEYYKSFKEVFPFNNTDIEELTFFESEKAFNDDDYRKYQAFYKKAKFEFRFLFGKDLSLLLEEFDKMVYKWKNEKKVDLRETIRLKLKELYFKQIIPEMEKVLMLKTA